MPTYDYQCDGCGHTFEQYQGINDPKLKKCPECKKLKLRRLIGTGAAIVFKGSGFYQTDYRSEGYKKAAAADKPASDSSDSAKSSSDSAKQSGSAKSEGKSTSGGKQASGGETKSSKPSKPKSSDG